MRMPPPPRHIKHNISHSPSGWKSTGRLAAWRDVGKSPFPGCCPHRVGGRGSFRGLSIKTNPSHEGPTLLTSLITPQAPPPDTITLGGGISTYESGGGGDTNIQVDHRCDPVTHRDDNMYFPSFQWVWIFWHVSSVGEFLFLWDSFSHLWPPFCCGSLFLLIAGSSYHSLKSDLFVN